MWSLAEVCEFQSGFKKLVWYNLTSENNANILLVTLRLYSHLESSEQGGGSLLGLQSHRGMDDKSGL